MRPASRTANLFGGRGTGMREPQLHHDARDVEYPSMKTIGLLGGMSWASSVEYYRVINEACSRRLGGLHSARCLLYSFDFEEIAALQRANAWERAAARLIEAARALERAGADLLVICTNTMHKVFDEVERSVGLPLLHIADATAERVRAAGLRRVGLVATRFTMEEDFYRGRLATRYNIEAVVPPAAEREEVHRIIFDELCRDVLREESRRRLQAIIQGLVDRGLRGIILGCTEIGLAIKQEHSPVPLFDTTIIHAEAAAEYALNGYAGAAPGQG